MFALENIVIRFMAMYFVTGAYLLLFTEIYFCPIMNISKFDPWDGVGKLEKSSLCDTLFWKSILEEKQSTLEEIFSLPLSKW